MARLMQSLGQREIDDLNNQRKEEAMKRTITTLAALVTITTPVLASSGQETMEISLLAILFLIFGALIIVGQLVPGLLLLFSALKSLFGRTAKKSAPVTGKNT